MVGKVLSLFTFILIDLVVSNVLALGMMMMSPATISLPIKDLFVAIDGWSRVSQGLIFAVFHMNELAYLQTKQFYLVLLLSAPPILVATSVYVLIAIFKQ